MCMKGTELPIEKISFRPEVGSLITPAKLKIAKKNFVANLKPIQGIDGTPILVLAMAGHHSRIWNSSRHQCLCPPSPAGKVFANIFCGKSW